MFDTERLRAHARQTGFLKRAGKLKPEDFLETLMFSEYDHRQLSLQDCCNDIMQYHHTSLSKVGLHKRFNANSLAFVKAVLAEQMTARLELNGGKRWHPFSRVLIADSCKFLLPEHYKEDYPPMGRFAGGSSLMNIQYAFDIKNGNWENLEFTQATRNDQSHSRRRLEYIHQDELHIRDLGFITHDYLLKVVRQKAYFLNRLHTACRPVETATGKAIDWSRLYRSISDKRESVFETRITIGHGNKAFECRLIAVAVPDEVWRQRIRKANIQAKRQSYTLTQEYKDRARFSLFITNTEPGIIPAEDVVKLYRIRWQIELVFKNWKSLWRIHQVKAIKKERMECQMLAKLLLVLMNWKIYRCMDAITQENAPGNSCSMWKLFKYTRRQNHIIRKIAAGQITILYWYKNVLSRIVKSLLLEHKKEKTPAFEIVNHSFSPLG